MPKEMSLTFIYTVILTALLGNAVPAFAADPATPPARKSDAPKSTPPSLDIEVDAAIKDVESYSTAPSTKGTAKDLDWDAEAYNRIDLGRDAQSNNNTGGPGDVWRDKPSGEDMKRGFTNGQPKKQWFTVKPNF